MIKNLLFLGLLISCFDMSASAGRSRMPLSNPPAFLKYNYGMNCGRVLNLDSNRDSREVLQVQPGSYSICFNGRPISQMLVVNEPVCLVPARDCSHCDLSFGVFTRSYRSGNLEYRCSIFDRSFF